MEFKVNLLAYAFFLLTNIFGTNMHVNFFYIKEEKIYVSIKYTQKYVLKSIERKIFLLTSVMPVHFCLMFIKILKVG